MRKRACIIDFARKVERVLCPVADCEIFLENKNEKKRMRGKKRGEERVDTGKKREEEEEKKREGIHWRGKTRSRCCRTIVVR